MFCMFGIHLDKDSRFDRMRITHPQIYGYCMDKLGLREVIRYCGIVPQIRRRAKNEQDTKNG